MSSTVSHPHAPPRRSPSLAALLNPTPTNAPPFFRRASSPRSDDPPSHHPHPPSQQTHHPQHAQHHPLQQSPPPPVSPSSHLARHAHHGVDTTPTSTAATVAPPSRRPRLDVSSHPPVPLQHQQQQQQLSPTAAAPLSADRQRTSSNVTTSPHATAYARKRPRTAESPPSSALPAMTRPRSPPPPTHHPGPVAASPAYSAKMPPPERPASATLNGATGRASASPSFAHRPLPSPGMPGAPSGPRRLSGGGNSNVAHSHGPGVSPAGTPYNHHNISPGSRPAAGPGMPSPGSPDDVHVGGGPIPHSASSAGYADHTWSKNVKPMSRRTSNHPSSNQVTTSGPHPSPPTASLSHPAHPHSQPQPQPQPQSHPHPHPHQQPHVGSVTIQHHAMQPPPRLEPSIFTVSPLDEFTVEVGEWLWAWLSDIWARGDGHLVEIEAKIGILIDTTHGARLDWPVATETPLTNAHNVRFESSMTEAQHKGYNQILNKRVEESAVKGYQGAPIKYSHRYEVDDFYPLSKGTKVRVTRDSKTGVVKDGGVVIKERIADMNVFSPKREFDYRISISLERPTSLPQSKASARRYKDRISYEHQICQVDLTQVKADMSSEDARHELEVEFKSAHSLLQQAERYAHNLDNEYHEMLQVFLNNVRMLVRNASKPQEVA